MVALESGATGLDAARLSTFAREGYMQNPIAYRSVRMIAEAAASMPLLLYEGVHELEAHPLLDLIAQANAGQTSADFSRAGTATCWSPATRMPKRS